MNRTDLHTGSCPCPEVLKGPGAQNVDLDLHGCLAVEMNPVYRPDDRESHALAPHLGIVGYFTEELPREGPESERVFNFFAGSGFGAPPH